jgi:elongation factor 2
VCFEVVDAKMHADSAHRRGDQIMPTMRRACFAALLTAQPKLVEPIFNVEIQVPDSCVGAICRSLKKRRAMIQSDTVTDGTPLHIMRAYLPVAESFGFSTELRSETSGQAFPLMSFDHWQTIDDDPLVLGTTTANIVLKTRQRKRLPATIPPLDSFIDKL